MPTWPDSLITSTASPALRSRDSSADWSLTTSTRDSARDNADKVSSAMVQASRRRSGSGTPSLDFACSAGLRAITAAVRDLAII